MLRMLDCLTEPNRVALLISMHTGARIGDVLNLRCSQLKTIPTVYTEQKTGKERLLHISKEDQEAALTLLRPDNCDYVFPGRDPAKPRTRQAVWKDLNRVAKLYRVDGKRLRASVSPHTARKVYAVNLYHATEQEGLYDPLRTVQVDLNHADPNVTFLYALADLITERRLRAHKKS